MGAIPTYTVYGRMGAIPTYTVYVLVITSDMARIYQPDHEEGVL